MHVNVKCLMFDTLISTFEMLMSLNGGVVVYVVGIY